MLSTVFFFPHSARLSSHEAHLRCLDRILALPSRVEPEKPKSAGGGIQDEKPIAVKSITCSGLLPEGMCLRAVRFFTPEVDGVVELKWKLNGRKITFTVPEFLVYGVVELDY